jgi:hypothetical protein
MISTLTDRNGTVLSISLSETEHLDLDQAVNLAKDGTFDTLKFWFWLMKLAVNRVLGHLETRGL